MLPKTMGWEPTIYSAVGFVAAPLFLVIAITAYRHRSVAEARPFAGLMLALGGWALLYGTQLGFTTPEAQLVWQRAGLAIGGTIPTLWILFTVRYAGKSEWLTRRRELLLALDPTLFAAFTLTNPIHGLIIEGATYAPDVASGSLVLSLGVGYLIHITYAYVIVAAGLGLLVRVVVRGSALYWQQAAALILGGIPPFAANMAFTFRVNWGPMPAVDLTPFAFVLTGVFFSLALFRFDLLERAPIAREQIIDEMGDGLIVLDTDDEIVEINPVAREILDPTPEVGDSIEGRVPLDTKRPDGSGETVQGRTVEATVDGWHRVYDVRLSTLTDHHGRNVGTGIALRDVTQRNAYEQRLEVTQAVVQRVLRHNLRNDMNLVLGRAESLAESTSGPQAEAAREIREITDEFLGLADKTRQMVALGDYEASDVVVVDVRRFVEPIVAECRRANPGATVGCDVPRGVQLTLPDERLLEIAVRNLLENALEHNTAAQPWANVRAERRPDAVRIQVSDNGPGVPAVEREVLERGAETPLEHGSGVGLWLTYWSVTILDGEISFRSRSPRGSVVTIDVPGVTGPSEPRSA